MNFENILNSLREQLNKDIKEYQETNIKSPLLISGVYYSKMSWEQVKCIEI